MFDALILAESLYANRPDKLLAIRSRLLATRSAQHPLSTLISVAETKPVPLLVKRFIKALNCSLFRQARIQEMVADGVLTLQFCWLICRLKWLMIQFIVWDWTWPKKSLTLLRIFAF